MKYQAFLGTDEFTYSDELQEIYKRMNSFIESITDGDTESGTFEILNDVVGDIPHFYASVCFPTWAEALFLIQFFEYSWELLEESE